MNEHYYLLIKNLMQSQLISKPRGKTVKELLNYIIVLNDPRKCLVSLPLFETNEEYVKKELEWYLSGSNKISDLGKFKKCWEFCSDNGVHVNSAYGHRIFGKHPRIKLNQWKWVLKKLKSDRDSRQAVINLNSSFDKEKDTKDFVCTMFLQVILRNNELHWVTVMRSQDAVLGTRNDIPAFTSLQRIMAHQLGVKLGTYTHFCNSIHLYEKYFDKANTLVKHYPPAWFTDKTFELDIKDLINKYKCNLVV